MQKKLKIKIGFFSLLLFLILALTRPDYFSALFIAVSIHELGHLVGARLCRIPLKELKLGIFGAGLTPSNSLISYKKEIILCLFGPLANFFTVFICFVFKIKITSPVFYNFLLSSFALGTVNLLPIESFDGGRILSALLFLFISQDRARRIVSVISFIFIFSLWSLSVYLLLRTASSLSLFVFSSYLFAKIFLRDNI